MRVFFLTITFLFFTKAIFAQNFDTTLCRKNVIYLEGLGNSPMVGYSLNYERKIARTRNGFISCRVGFSYDFYQNFVFPLLFNRIINKRDNNHLEVGLGTAFYFFKYWDGQIKLDKYFNPLATGNVMYRYQKPNGRFIFRAGWTPSLIFQNDDFLTGAFLFIAVGASMGYAF